MATGELEERLERLKDCGMIIKYNVLRYQGRGKERACTEGDCTVYSDTYRGSLLGRKLGAPPFYRREDMMMKERFGKMRTMSSCVLWNQVVLNQLYYRDNLVYFRIQSFVSISGWHTLCIPLLMQCRNKQVIFERAYIRETPERLRERAEIWGEYAMRTGKKFTLVLMCDSDAHEQWVESSVCDGTEDRYKLSVTSIREWLHPYGGTVNYYHNAL